MATLEERYWAKVDVRGLDECWVWLGLRDLRGYGRIYTGKRASGTEIQAYAHRVGCELAQANPLPPGIVVRHRCDNPPCQNPDHLELGTQHENLRDMFDRGRARVRGEQNGHAKLTEGDVLKIRSLYREGWLQREIADLFEVSVETVSGIVRGRRWKHVPVGEPV